MDAGDLWRDLEAMGVVGTFVSQQREGTRECVLPDERAGGIGEVGKPGVAARGAAYHDGASILQLAQSAGVGTGMEEDRHLICPSPPSREQYWLHVIRLAD